MAILVLLIIILCAVIAFVFLYRMKFFFIFTSIFCVVVVLRAGVYVVPEGSQVVITQFGEIIGGAKTKAGLYFKIPFIWRVNYFEKRLFTETERENRIATKDTYIIDVNTAYIWKIVDAVKFIQSVGDISEARIMLKNIGTGAIRQLVSTNNLANIIRSPDYKPPEDNLVFKSDKDKPVELIDLAPKIGRPQLIQKMISDANNVTRLYGIEVVTILIRDIKFDPIVENMIHERMIQNRLRLSAKLISEGERNANIIDGRGHKMYSSIIAPAKKKALMIRGKADAMAANILNRAYGQDIEFHNFWGKMKAYSEKLPKSSQGLILSTDNEFLQLMHGDSPPTKKIKRGEITQKQSNNQSTAKDAHSS